MRDLESERQKIETRTGQQVSMVSMSYPLFGELARALAEERRFVCRSGRLAVDGVTYSCERFLDGHRLVWYNRAGDILGVTVAP